MIGAVVAGLISFLGVIWQNRAQETRLNHARAALIADRTRDERRSAYAALLVSSRKADARVTRHFNEEQFIFGPSSAPGIENYDLVWDSITGDLSEHVALASLVASEPVRNQIQAVLKYFHSCVFAIAEDGGRPDPEPDPVRVLEDLLAKELEYRDAQPNAVGAVIDATSGDGEQTRKDSAPAS